MIVFVDGHCLPKNVILPPIKYRSQQPFMLEQQPKGFCNHRRVPNNMLFPDFKFLLTFLLYFT